MHEDSEGAVLSSNSKAFDTSHTGDCGIEEEGTLVTDDSFSVAL
jgi:hypothetical protein